MANIAHDKRYGTTNIRFRYGGRYYQRALKSTSRRHIQATIGRVEETISLLERGRIVMPSDVDPGDFILSDGQLQSPTAVKGQVTLKQLFGIYLESLPPGAKEETTIIGEKLHHNHLLRHLGSRKLVRSITKADLQGYIARRCKDMWHGKPISPQTVKKEITTLRLTWNWAHDNGLVSTQPPTRGLIYPKVDEKYPFMTYSEIQRFVAELDDPDEVKKYWESLYLELHEVADVLKVVKKAARYPYVYPMVVLAAHTGARRSEILRSRREDIDFRNGRVIFREKKSSKTSATTFRSVEMSGLVADTMRQWLASPEVGLTHTMSLRHDPKWASVPVSVHAAHNQLKKALAKSKWNVIRGFHVFRHSFASNMAAAGVDPRIIDEFLGHQTEAMRKRYRHIFPHVRQQAIAAVFADNG